MNSNTESLFRVAPLSLPSLPPQPPPALLQLKTPVVLSVRNLDGKIGKQEWKELIYAMFKQHVEVLEVSLNTQTNGLVTSGEVTVASEAEAHVAISKLHHQKVGCKRIQVNVSPLPPGHKAEGFGSGPAPLFNPAVALSNLSPVDNARKLSLTSDGAMVGSGSVQRTSNKLKMNTMKLLSGLPEDSRLISIHEFANLFEKRFHHKMSMTDISKMKDILEIISSDADIFVQLRSDTIFQQNQRRASRDSTPVSQPYSFSAAAQDSSRCQLHCSPRELESPPSPDLFLPNVVQVVFQDFGAKLIRILELHGGQMPLFSFPRCFDAVYPAEPLSIGDAVSDDESRVGVPLEHIILCVPRVSISWCKNAVKMLHLAPETETRKGKDAAVCTKCERHRASVEDDTSAHQLASPGQCGRCSGNAQQQLLASIPPPLQEFARSVNDLMKHTPGSVLEFNKFIPAYHHYFGKQCRVADYGFTKLLDLLLAIPHVVQVLGAGNNKILTLTHRVQIRRFTNDILRVLKSQPMKRIPLKDFPSTFHSLVGSPFRVTDYGMCLLSDAINFIPHGVVLISYDGEPKSAKDPRRMPQREGAEMETRPESRPSPPQPLVLIDDPQIWLYLPLREQTPEERARTRQFAREVVELLRNHPRCRLLLNKFIPAYHHHFGHQCRVSDYGFSKLIDLMEAIGDVVTLKDEPPALPVELSSTITSNSKSVDKKTEEQPDRFLQLNWKEMVGVLANQVTAMLKTIPNQTLPVELFLATYHRHHGYELRLADFGVPDVRRLTQLILNVVRVDCGPLHHLLVSQPPPPTTMASRSCNKLTSNGDGDLPRKFPDSDVNGSLSNVNSLNNNNHQSQSFLSTDGPSFWNSLSPDFSSNNKSNHLCASSSFPPSSPNTAAPSSTRPVLPNVSQPPPDLIQPQLVLLDRCFVIAAAAQVLLILIDHEEETIEADELKRKYEMMFVQPLDLPTVLCEMRSYVQVILPDDKREKRPSDPSASDRIHFSSPSNESALDATLDDSFHHSAVFEASLTADSSKGSFGLSLCPLQQFARRVRLLISGPLCGSHGSSKGFSVDEVEKAYEALYGPIPDNLKCLGFNSFLSLLQAIPHVVHLRGSPMQRTICLQQNLLERFEALLQSQDERPVYHLLSGFSGPLKSRKQLMKENLPVSGGTAGVGGKNKIFAFLPGGGKGCNPGKGGRNATAKDDDKKPSSGQFVSEEGKAQSEGIDRLAESSNRNGCPSQTGVNPNFVERRHPVVQSHFDIVPGAPFLRLDEIVVGDQAPTSLHHQHDFLLRPSHDFNNSIYFMPEGGRTSSPSLDSTDGRVDTPPAHLDLLSPGEMASSSAAASATDASVNDPWKSSSSNPISPFPPFPPPLSRSPDFYSGFADLCRLAPPPPAPLSTTPGISPQDSLSFLSGAFSPPESLVSLAGSFGPTSSSRPTNSRFLSNNVISKWISTGEAARQAHNRIGKGGKGLGAWRNQ